MLVLSRLENETIRIGDDIALTVLEIGNGIVRLGIIAPRNVPVHRLEVYNAIHKKQEEKPSFQPRLYPCP